MKHDTAAAGAVNKRPAKLEGGSNVLAFQRRVEEPVTPPSDLSYELRYTDDLIADGSYAIAGVSSNGDTDETLYQWQETHWELQVDAIMRAHALKWMRRNRPDKANKTNASGSLETARTEMCGLEECTVPKMKGHPIIPVLGAYLHIREGEIHVCAPDRAMGITYQVPAAFDWANVRDDGTYCPKAVDPTSRWGRYLQRFMPDVEVRELLQEACASSLLPMTLEKGFFLCGEGSNGKSTLLHVLKALHPKHQAVNIKGLDGRFAMQPLQGKTLALVSEMPRRITPELQDALKALISRDPQQLEAKRKDIFTFTPMATWFFAVNTFPAVSGHEHGFWRKVMGIPFDVCLKEGDPDRIPDFHKLIVDDPKEMKQVLDWLLEGALRLLKRGGFNDKMPERVVRLREQHRLQTDTVMAYLEDREVYEFKYVKTSKLEIYKDYSNYTTLEAGKKPVAAEEFWTRVRNAFPEAKYDQINFGKGKLRTVSLQVEGVKPARDETPAVVPLEDMPRRRSTTPMPTVDVDGKPLPF